MKHVTEKYEQQLQDLAADLVTPERFGHLALDDTVEMDLSELADVPLFSEDGLRS